MGRLMVVVTRFLSLCAVLLAIPIIATAQPAGWYSNSGANGESIIYQDMSGLRIVWGNSYIYRPPGTVNLYWYAQVIYRNMGSQTLPQTCIGSADPSLAKEHIRGTQGIPPDGDGFVAAEETFCSRNPNFTGIIEPGGALYSWAIFHNVPSGGEVFLEWSYPGNAGFSQWVDPWFSPYPSTVPRPAECPPELVTLGTCQSKVPEGTAPNLIVLVHGCCTDASGVYEWNALADTIGGEIIKKQTPWEILVWDWTQDTPTTGPDQIGKAYENAKKQSLDLSLAIAKLNHTYEYIHLIGHSSGARLIHLAAKRLANYYRTKKDKPFQSCPI